MYGDALRRRTEMDVIIPGYEHPVWRFLRLRGDWKEARNGAAFSLTEALLYMSEEEFPLVIRAAEPLETSAIQVQKSASFPPIVLTRDELLFHAMELLDSGNGELFGKGRAQIESMVGAWKERTNWLPESWRPILKPWLDRERENASRSSGAEGGGQDS